MLCFKSRGPATPGRPWPTPVFCVAKRKKRYKGKNERASKQKLLKRCHQGQNIIVLVILEHLEFKNFSYGTIMVAENTFQCSLCAPNLKSISLDLSNKDNALPLYISSNNVQIMHYLCTLVSFLLSLILHGNILVTYHEFY